MCSIAETSTPWGSLEPQVSIEAARSAATSSTPVFSEGHMTTARATAGAGDSTRKVTCVTIPRVPSEPMNRSIRSIPGRAKYPADRFATSGMRYVESGRESFRPPC